MDRCKQDHALPNADHAEVAIEKLRDYCLSEGHPTGRHKARVFAAALGLKAENAEALRQALQAAARHESAELGANDLYGQRYVIDFTMSHEGRQARVRSAWIVRVTEDFPRFVTCYIP